MKKIFTILSCAIILAVSSCTKQYITPNANQTIYADVAPSDWKLFTDNNGSESYSVAITVNVITSTFTKVGGLVVAISYDGGTTYEQLPEVYSNISYSYTYNAGNVSLYAQSANGATAIQPNLPMKVKIILVNSN